LGANDIASTSLSKRKPPKLATPHPTSSITRVRLPQAMSGTVYITKALLDEMLNKSSKQTIKTETNCRTKA